ncbi:MAG: PaaI family thioesterase [Paracoccaceae bacterium]
MTSALPELGLIRDETGAQTLLGYVVDLRPGDGKGRCYLDLGPQHGNRHGGLHGGIISCLLDNAMGFAASLSADPKGATRFLTISMTTQYLAPAREGRVTATGGVTGGGKSTLFVDGQLEDEAGRLLATSTGVYKRVRT